LDMSVCLGLNVCVLSTQYRDIEPTLKAPQTRRMSSTQAPVRYLLSILFPHKRVMESKREIVLRSNTDSVTKVVVILVVNPFVLLASHLIALFNSVTLLLLSFCLFRHRMSSAT